jgi:hypothetical protein
MAEEFIAPDIYNGSGYQTFINTYFPNVETSSELDLAESFFETELSGFASSSSFSFKTFQSAIAGLPENLKKEGVLAQIDLRPLLLAHKEYLLRDDVITPPGASKTKWIEGLDKTIEALNTKYVADAKEFVARKGAAGDDAQTQATVDAFLKNTGGYSPLKFVKDDLEGINTIPITTTPDTTTSTGGAIIDEEGNININNIGADLGGLSYKQYLQRYATTTIEDLLRLEDTGEVTTSEINAGEFVANLTGKVSGTNGTNPVMWSLAQAKEYLWSLNRNQVADLQDSLRDAGYFDKLGAYPYKGDQDEATVLAWDLFLSDALRNGQTPSARLQSASDSFAQRMAAGQGNLFMDEADVRGAALALGSKVLNRGLDKTELETLTAAVRNWEIEAYKTKSTGQSETGDIFSDVDVTARINSYMQETYNEETVINSLPENIQFLKSVFG